VKNKRNGILVLTFMLSASSGLLLANTTTEANETMSAAPVVASDESAPTVVEAPAAIPQPEPTQMATPAIETEVTKPVNVFPVAEQLTSSQIEDKRDGYLAKRSMVLGQNVVFNEQGNPVKQFYIGWGQANVSVKPTDIAFGDARVAAFESALLAAKGDYVKSQRRQIASESMQTFFQDERDFDPEKAVKNDDYFNRMLDKLSTLGEAKIDALLKQAGEDPSKFGVKEKQRLAEESFQKTISVNAMESVSGVRTLATFEDLNTVGVIIVYSQQLQAQAQDIARGKGVAKTQRIAGKPTILEQIESSIGGNPNYIFQHGIRILSDDKGNPALVAFGQSGVRVTNSDSKFKIDMAIKAAKSAAQSFASAQFSEFVNATVALEDKTQILNSTQINKINDSGMTTEEEVTNVGKLIDNYVKQNSRTTITGMTTIKTWSANHPDTGHLIVGEVLVWSPFTRDVAKQKFNNPANNLNKNTPPPKNTLHQSTDFESDASF
jgi:hypothetical protein